jgi:hypothetical protein
MRTLSLCGLFALAGCPVVDLGDTPSEIGLCNPRGGFEYFQAEIEPHYLKLPDAVNSCARNGNCHQAHGPVLVVGKDNDNYRAVLQNITCGQPSSSPLLTKPMGGIDGHGGGDLFQPGSPEEQTFLMWF